MMKIEQAPIMIGAGLGLLAVVWIAYKGIKGTAAAVGSAAVDVVDGVIAGTVEGIGGAVGIPKTSQTECQKAKAEGRTWDASFACPAGEFIKWWWNN